MEVSNFPLIFQSSGKYFRKTSQYGSSSSFSAIVRISIISEKLVSMEVFFYLILLFYYLFPHFRKTSQYGRYNILIPFHIFHFYISEKLVSMEGITFLYLSIFFISIFQKNQLVWKHPPFAVALNSTVVFDFRKTSQYGSPSYPFRIDSQYLGFQKNQLVWKL